MDQQGLGRALLTGGTAKDDRQAHRQLVDKFVSG